MKVEVKYSSMMLKVTGKSIETIEINEDSTVLSLVGILIEKYGLEFDQKRKSMLIAINGSIKNDGHVLKEHDKVSFLKLVAGG